MINTCPILKSKSMDLVSLSQHLDVSIEHFMH